MCGSNKTIYLDGPVLYGSCTCEITECLSPGHRMGLVPEHRGRKAMGIAFNGTVHAYLYLDDTDVITGAEIIPGAYGANDGAILKLLESYTGCTLRYGAS